jgi:hypothetical protein
LVFIFFSIIHKIVSFSSLPNSFFSYLNPRFIHFFTPDLIPSEELNEIVFQYSGDSKILFQIAQIACIFPDYSEVFSTIIPFILNFEDLSVPQQYMKFELIKAAIGRNLNTMISEFSTILEYSKELSQTIRSSLYEFQKQNTEFSSYKIIDYMTSKRIYLRDYWKSLIRLNPNNFNLIKHFYSFLIECNSNFIRAFNIKSKFEKMETAFNSDLATIHYVRVYPQHAHRMLKHHSSNSEEKKYYAFTNFKNTVNLQHPEFDLTIQREFQYILKSLPFKYTPFFQF